MFWPFQGPALGQNSIQRNSRFFSIYTHKRETYFLKSHSSSNIKISHVEVNTSIVSSALQLLCCSRFSPTLGFNQEPRGYISPSGFQGDLVIHLIERCTPQVSDLPELFRNQKVKKKKKKSPSDGCVWVYL